MYRCVRDISPILNPFPRSSVNVAEATRLETEKQPQPQQQPQPAANSSAAAAAAAAAAEAIPAPPPEDGGAAGAILPRQQTNGISQDGK